MNNKYEKYLPLGTVVMLKKGKHRAMIVGYGAKIESDDNAPFYDYIGCLFPEGIFTMDQTLVFNHEQINKIYYMGYVDDEVKRFNKKIKDIMDKLENN